MPKRILPQQLAADIRRLARELGHQPSSADYSEHGHYNKSAPVKLFGSWRAAVEAAGLVYQRPTIDPFADLRRVAKTLGRLPACKEYEALGKHNRTVLYRRAPQPNWSSVLVACFGVSEDEARQPSTRGNRFGKRRSTKERLAELAALARKLRRVPSQDEAAKYLNTRILLKRISGGWLAVCEAAGLDKPRSNKRPGQHLTKAECIREVVRVTNLLGRFPSQKQFAQYGRAEYRTIARRVTGTDSWSAVRKTVFPGLKSRQGDRVQSRSTP